MQLSACLWPALPQVRNHDKRTLTLCIKCNLLRACDRPCCRSATMIKLYDRDKFQNDIDVVERAGHDPRSMLYHRCEWCLSFGPNASDVEHRGSVSVRITLHEPKAILARCRTHTFVRDLAAPNMEDQLRLAKRRASIERMNAEDAVEAVQEVTLLLDKAKVRKQKVKDIASAKVRSCDEIFELVYSLCLFRQDRSRSNLAELNYVLL